MKKLTIIFALLTIFSITLNAQNFAKRGVIEAGGSLGFSSQTAVMNGQSDDKSTTTISIEPYVGYFIIDGVELGLIPSFVRSSYGDNSNSMFGIFFAPAYNFDTRGNLFPFIEGRIGYNSRTIKTPGGESTLSGLSWGGRGGIKVKVGCSSLANVALSYMQYTYNPENWTGDRNGYNIFAIHVGFTVFFGR